MFGENKLGLEMFKVKNIFGLNKLWSKKFIERNFNPNQTGGGHISPPVFQKIIALEPNVGLTSDQAVNSSFSVVLRSKKKFGQFGP